jgi:restriction system protein
MAIAAHALAYERQSTDYWKQLDWRQLEFRVAALFRRKGYTSQATPASNDKGVDVIAKKPGEKLVVQCKQHAKAAQRNFVSELLGVKVAEQANRAILICTGGFTAGAEEYAHLHGIELWDSSDLAREEAE